MVAGIVLLALGVKKTLEHVDEPLKAMPAFALAGGVAVYLLGQAAYRLRNRQGADPARLAAAAACLVLALVAGPGRRAGRAGRGRGGRRRVLIAGRAGYGG